MINNARAAGIYQCIMNLDYPEGVTTLNIPVEIGNLTDEAGNRIKTQIVAKFQAPLEKMPQGISLWSDEIGFIFGGEPFGYSHQDGITTIVIDGSKHTGHFIHRK